MKNIKTIDEFTEIKMPVEFEEMSKLPKFADKIKNRPKDPFRFYKKMVDFLKYTYRGSLPRNIVDLAKKLGYTDYLVALFKLSEKTYKETYKKEYDDFYNNKSFEEKKKLFFSADFGARSIFELEQDTVASNLFEDMLKYYGLGALSINGESTGRDSSETTTKCDLIYSIKDRDISFPIEVKTKWKKSIDSDENVSMRQSAKTLIKDEGMVLVIYLNLNRKIYGGVKAMVIDSVGNTVTHGEMIVTNKKCDNYAVNADNLMSFNFWEENDMRDMLNNIYLLYKKRETK
jgi:hypothetical protein